jgi:hypothetical protein
MSLAHLFFWLFLASVVATSLALGGGTQPTESGPRVDHPAAELVLLSLEGGAELIGGLVAPLMAGLFVLPTALLSVIVPLALRGPRHAYAPETGPVG